MMKSIKLNNGTEMPEIGFGTWDLRGKACTEAVREAIQCGYRLIDTAIMYGNEKETGEAVRTCGVSRSELFITTKLDYSCNSYEKAKKAIDHSLKVMGLDYLDMVMVHEPYPGWDGMYQAILDAVEEGKVRVPGVSNFFRRNYDLLLSMFDTVPAVNQIECNVYYTQSDLCAYLREHGTAVQAWSPLAQGKNAVFRNPLLTKIGGKHNKSAAQTALRYLIQNDIAAVPKTSHMDRMIENMDLYDFELSEEEMKMIASLDTGRTLNLWTEGWL